MTTLAPTPRPIAKDLWVVDHLLKLPLGMRMPLCATVVRLADGGLWVHSPTPLGPELATAVEALGPVRDLVAPNRFHHLSIVAWSQRFPGARIWGAPGLADKRRDLSLTGVLGDGASPAPPWAGEIAALPLAGAPSMNEVVFFHGASRTLVCTDLLFNVQKPASAMTGFVLSLMGTKGRFAMSRLWRRYARDRPALKRSVEEMLAWDFARVIPAHGEVFESDGANGDTRAATRAALAWMLR